MPKRKGNFNAWRLEKLADPINAAHYLNAALEDSPEVFLDAIKDTIQARSVSKVAQQAQVTRESLYRSFSVTGNPTFETLSSVLRALGLKLSGVMAETAKPPATASTSSGVRAHKRRTKYGRRGGFTLSRQLTLPFDHIVSANRAFAMLDQVKVGIVGLGSTNSTWSLVGGVPLQVVGASTSFPKAQQRWLEGGSMPQEQPLSGTLLTSHATQGAFMQTAR